MHQAWQPLLANVAVIAAFISFWTMLQGWLQKVAVHRIHLLFGTICGATGVAMMSMPFEIVPGVLLDLRTVVIVLAGFFGGPTGGIAAGAITGAYRISLGGAGMAPGLAGIAFAMMTGIYFDWHRRGAPKTFRDILHVALAGAGGSIVLIVILPMALHGTIFEYSALPAAILNFVSLMLAGSAIVHENRRQEIARANEIYGAIMDALPDCLNAKDSAGRFLVANPATAALLGAGDTAALIGRTDADFYDAHTAAEFRADEERIIRWGQPETLEQKFVRRDGATAWLSTLKVPFPSSDSRGMGIITHNRDVTAQKQLELNLAEAQARLSDALTHMADGLVMFDGDGRLVYSSNRFRQMFSIPDTAMPTGTPLRSILQQAVEHMGIVLPEGQTAAQWVDEELGRVTRMESTEIQLSGGRWFENHHRAVRDGGWLTVFSDITERKRKDQALIELNAQLEILARTDGLTGLANRKTFDDKLYAEFARSQRHGNTLGLMLLDVDRFKTYNDIYGHPEGDACLKAIADCLKLAARRPPDVVARYGGEEFVAIFPETDEAGMLTIAEQFRQSIRSLRRVHIGSDTGAVTVSIGIAVMGPQTDLRGPADLIRKADEALYRAKAAGRDCVRLAEMPESAKAGAKEQKAS
jgi:diguanylate cyclase (GGDEF)-like protein/PAS domain S-box-containing protein